MDTFFLSQRLLVTARYRHQSIWLRKERSYYYRYMLKLCYNLEYLGSKDVQEALNYVKSFEKKQSKRIKNGVFVKPKKMLELACKDATDVLHGMKRWDGVEENLFDNNWAVSFRSNV